MKKTKSKNSSLRLLFAAGCITMASISTLLSQSNVLDSLAFDIQKNQGMMAPKFLEKNRLAKELDAVNEKIYSAKREKSSNFISRYLLNSNLQEAQQISESLELISKEIRLIQNNNKNIYLEMLREINQLKTANLEIIGSENVNLEEKNTALEIVRKLENKAEELELKLLSLGTDESGWQTIQIIPSDDYRTIRLKTILLEDKLHKDEQKLNNWIEKASLLEKQKNSYLKMVSLYSLIGDDEDDEQGFIERSKGTELTDRVNELEHKITDLKVEIDIQQKAINGLRIKIAEFKSRLIQTQDLGK